jgi:tyrosine-specific transport protein
MMKNEAKTLESSNFSTLSGILLLAGTCIGAGMLALPVVTGVAGFIPSLFVSILCWFVMLCTGLLFLEATLWMDGDTNLLSMAHRFLGPFGKVIGGLAFLFLYYCLEVSYMAGGAPIFNSLLSKFDLAIPEYLSFFVFSGIFALIVFIGAKAIDRVNWLLMTALFLSYFILTTLGTTEVQSKLLTHQNWGLSFIAAPTLFSAYGYHNIIPSLSKYMQKNANQLRATIVIGTAIPFVIYTVWQWMIIGTIPQEQLVQAAEMGTPINLALEAITGNAWISTFCAFFGFFALVTSLLGVSLSMVDFLADGLKTSNKGWNRLLLCLLVFLPSALFAAHNPHIFIKAIGFAGGYGEAILNGIFPILMVWVGRYYLKLSSPYQLAGGRFTLGALMLFILSIIALETYLILG